VSAEERDRQLVEEYLAEIEAARDYPDADHDELDQERDKYLLLHDRIMARVRRRAALRALLMAQPPERTLSPDRTSSESVA